MRTSAEDTTAILDPRETIRTAPHSANMVPRPVVIDHAIPVRIVQATIQQLATGQVEQRRRVTLLSGLGITKEFGLRADK